MTVALGADGEESGPATDPDATWIDLLKATAIIWVVQLAMSVPLGLLLITQAANGLDSNHPTEIATGEPLAILAIGLLTSAATVFILWHFMCRKYDRSFRDGFVLTPIDRRTVLPSVAIGFCAAIVVGLAAGAVSTGDSYMSRLVEAPGGLLTIAALALLLPPIEELQFRGFVFPIVKKHGGTVAAIGVTALWFAGAHVLQLAGDWLTIPFILGVAIVLTVQRHITNSLTPCMITHWVYNAVLVGLSLLGEWI